MKISSVHMLQKVITSEKFQLQSYANNFEKN